MSYYITVDYLREKDLHGSVSSLAGIAEAMRYAGIARVESLNDWSDQPVFQKGTGTPTILLGIMAGPKNQVSVR
jgi:hypothetical protein